jgi:hypothetical protein
MLQIPLFIVIGKVINEIDILDMMNLSFIGNAIGERLVAVIDDYECNDDQNADKQIKSFSFVPFFHRESSNMVKLLANFLFSHFWGI